MRKMAHAFRLGLLCAAIVYLGAATPPCTFRVPEGWNPAQTQWDGGCREGQANGLGVLKEQAGGKTRRFFFGRLRNGELELGVIDDEGYMAGWFKNGTVVSSDDRKTYIDGFAEGEKAALEAASRFRKIGNIASAKFFEAKAKKLSEAID